MDNIDADQELQCFLVLGMHRSGTSALAGLMDSLGISAPGELLPASETNRLGYFEPKEVVQLHDDLLASAGSGWADPRRFEVADESVTAPYREQLMTFVRDMSEKRFVLKDPRICRLLPMWRSILKDHKTTPLLIVRNPIGVAGSLAKRNRFPPSVTFPLWLRHVLDAEYGTRGMDRAFVRYEALVADGQAQLERLSSQVDGIPPVSGTHATLDQSEMHHNHADDEVAGFKGVSKVISEMSGRVLACHDDLIRDPNDAPAMKMLDDIRGRFDDLTEAFGQSVFEFAECLGRLPALESSLKRMEGLEDRLQRMEQTVSWRVTAPLRKIGAAKAG